MVVISGFVSGVVILFAGDNDCSIPSKLNGIALSAIPFWAILLKIDVPGPAWAHKRPIGADVLMPQPALSVFPFVESKYKVFMNLFAVLAGVCIFSVPCFCKAGPNVTGNNSPVISKPAPVSTPIPAQSAAAPAPSPQPTPTPQAQSQVISDEAIRVCLAERERDMYKQIVETTRSTLDNTKWIFDKMLTAFGTLLAIFGIIAFKNAWDHRKAIGEIKKTCENAERYERQAKDILGNVSKRVDGELKRIEKRGEQSVRKIIGEAEKERKISELWNEALRLHKERNYEEECGKYAQIEGIKSDIPEIFFNWCTVLCLLARDRKDDKFLEEASNIYTKLKALAYKREKDSLVRQTQAEAGTNLINAYGKAKRPDDARAIYDQIKALADAHRDEPALREQQAKAGTNLVNAYGDAERPDDARAIYDQIKALADAHRDEPALRQSQTIAGVNLTDACGKMGKPDDASAIRNEVKALADAHKDETGLRISWIMVGINLCDALINSGGIDKVKPLLDEIEPSTNDLPESHDKQEIRAEIQRLREKQGMQ